ncbi:MAG: 4-hydroxybenzoate octaprenyltransferase [Phycisphaerales bacterium]|nr:4-hydroxybenzoate octaprenyltransferase [Phycisphaerales bacterium]
MSTAIARTSCPLAAMLADIKIAHSVFALPFAVLAAVMAGWPPAGSGVAAVSSGVFVGMIVLIVAAMVTARTAAMLSNRIFDRAIDARNPRTASRPLASGAASLSNYIFAIATASVLFLGIASSFWFLYGNPYPVLLAVPVLAWICAYGLFKRYTAWCHVWLGASLAMSVPAAAVAINPDAVRVEPSLWLLAGMVLCWVAGFDMIYALQDVAVDRAEGLYSMPSRRGVSGALWLSCVLHVVAVTLLTLVWWMDPRLGWVFLVGVVAVAALLTVEHATVHTWGTSRMALTFFTLNGVVSCLLGFTGVVDILV